MPKVLGCWEFGSLPWRLFMKGRLGGFLEVEPLGLNCFHKVSWDLGLGEWYPRHMNIERVDLQPSLL